MLHTDIPSRADIDMLSSFRAAQCISVYLPTSPLTQDNPENRLALKNAASAALKEVEAQGVRTPQIAVLNDIFEDIIDDSEFWARQGNSLAVFVSEERVFTFRLANQLSPMTEVADRFYVKPLLRAVTVPQSAFVLALAQGSVRLVEVSADMPAFTVPVAGMPTDIASAVGVSSVLDRSPSGRIQGDEGRKVRMRQYARKVDAALRSMLVGRETPLILAAAPPLEPIFRQVNTYPHLVEETLEGNPEIISDADLAAAARVVLDRLHTEQLAEMREKFGDLESAGLASHDLHYVAKAATYGVVSALMFDIDAFVAGTVDDDGRVTLTDENDAVSYGVIDEVVRRALATGATVMAARAADLPEGAHVAALLRYQI